MEKTQTVVAPRPGETRDCLDPWKMSFVHADGSVTLCCWSRPVGNIKDAPFGDLLLNDASKEMRRGLLTGRMPEDCVHCPARTLVPVAEFRRKVERFVAEAMKRGWTPQEALGKLKLEDLPPCYTAVLVRSENGIPVAGAQNWVQAESDAAGTFVDPSDCRCAKLGSHCVGGAPCPEN